MKKYSLILLIIFIQRYSYGQISSGTIDPNPYAELDIVSSNKGVLIPRVLLQSTTSSLPISLNATEVPPSLLVFNESSSADLKVGYYYWYNNTWNKIISSGESGIVGTVIYDSVSKIFTYTDSSGSLLNLPIDKIIQDHETTTMMTFDEGSKKLSYTNEKGNNPVIDLSMIGQPTGVAGGDLSGNYPNPTVVKLQAKPILATAPTTNQVLRFNGTAWGPQTLVNTEPWYVVGGTTQATSNTQNIYQTGNVGIGKNTTGAKLDVVSDVLINDLTLGKGGGNVSTNTATGYQALFKNTTGSANTGFGYQVLANNTTSSNNTAVGYQALTLNTGAANSAMGYQALGQNTTGSNNTAVGWRALYENVTGSNNSALGYDAGPDTGYGALTNTTAIGNGARVKESNTITLGNTFITNVYTSGKLNSTRGIYTGFNVLNADAILEGDSSTRGLLLPRLALTGATAAAPLTAHVAGMMVYNTATAGTIPNNVTPGQYYNNGSKWIKVGEYTTEPWYVGGTADTEATLNTQNIYQMGSVGIGKQNSSATIKLDVSSDALINGITVGKGTGNVSSNTAVGYEALLKNATTGLYNTATGYRSLTANTTGSGNTAFGYGSLLVNTTGGSNTSIGVYSLVANTTGSSNTALGYYALSRNTTGTGNVAVGYQALYENTTGTYNTALGYFSGSSTSSRTLTNTTALGYNASVTASNTIRLGNTSITDLYTDGRLNSTRGIYAGITTLNANAMLEVSSTTKGLLLPRLALTSTTSFSPLTAHVAGMVVYNTATAGVFPNDVSPGQYYNNGTRWVRVAEFATKPWYVAGGTTQATLNTQNIYQMGSVGIGKENSDATIKLDVASDALINGITVGRGGGNIETNTVLGSGALAKNTTGVDNVAIGLNALPVNTIGSNNVAVGVESLFVNTSGSNNVVLGRFAAQGNTTGSDNVVVGYSVLQGNTTGSRNTALGSTALNTNTTGTENTAVGYGAGPSGANFVNTTAVGYAASATASNMVRIGNTAVTKIMGQVGFTTSSDRRYKKDIETIPLGLAFINKLRPVAYVRKNNEEQTKEWGIIAQELQQVLEDIGYKKAGIVQEDHTPDHYLSIRYTDFIAPLIKGIQELSEENDSISKNIDKSDVVIEQLRKEIAELKQKVKQAVDKN